MDVPNSGFGAWPRRLRCHPRAATLALVVALHCVPLRKSIAEDRVDFKTLFYNEGNGRMSVTSPSLQWETDLTQSLNLYGIHPRHGRVSRDVMTAADLYARMMRSVLSSTGESRRFAFQAMGTDNEIAFSTSSSPRARDFQEAVLKWVAGFEATYSRFIPESLVGRIHREAGIRPVEIDAEAAEIFALCDVFHWRTFGVFDPTAGVLTALWDYRDAGAKPPSDAAVEAARALVGWSRVVRGPGSIFLPEPGMRLDLGGIGKEYAVDRLARLADAHGIRDYVISLGRDIRVRGRSPSGDPWRLGLEHPGQPDRCWGGVVIEDAALCCSGDYRRYFEADGQRYGHIVDPRTGRPADRGCRAAWVIAPTCVEAGILSTGSPRIWTSSSTPTKRRSRSFRTRSMPSCRKWGSPRCRRA
ncbi:MAG: hypothetical protein BWK77_03655 [Verrucomicrobia bacterium A1]|nr:MAG: hypothetical protein BWK77_03655 [Verrucomicrobia bacterium A1]